MRLGGREPASVHRRQTLRLPLTRRMIHIFLGSTAELNVDEALVGAIVLAYDGDPRLVAP